MTRQPIPALTVAPECLSPDGDWADQSAHTRLSGTMKINDHDFHVTAIEVIYEGENDAIKAVHPQLDEDIGAIVNLLGGCPEVQTINGREYVLYVVPFSA